MIAHPFADLICAYLDGLPSAADVLNDALEEAGRERVAVDGSAGERLALVLDEMLEEDVARKAAIEFARHVVGYCDSPQARALIQQKSSELDPTAAAVELPTSEVDGVGSNEDGPAGYTLLAQLGWSPRNTPKASAAWALWGALQIPVRYVAAAAQRANGSELEWQIERLKSLLSD